MHGELLSDDPLRGNRPVRVPPGECVGEIDWSDRVLPASEYVGKRQILVLAKIKTYCLLFSQNARVLRVLCFSGFFLKPQYFVFPFFVFGSTIG